MTNDNNQRPAEFDKTVMQWLPLLRQLACKLESNPQKHEDMVQDTIAVALHRWRAYKPEGKMSGWLTFIMRERLQGRRRREKRERRTISLDAFAFGPGRSNEDAFADITIAGVIALDSEQDAAVELHQVLDNMSDRGRSVLVKRAFGYEQGEIGEEIGVSRQRIEQIEKYERTKLRQRLNTVRIAA